MFNLFVVPVYNTIISSIILSLCLFFSPFFPFFSLNLGFGDMMCKSSGGVVLLVGSRDNIIAAGLLVLFVLLLV